MTDLSIDAFLNSGKTRAARFEQPGDTVTGKVTGEPRLVQRKDYTTGELMVWKDSGKPQMQLAVTVQTDQRDPSDDEDDGRRTLFIRGQMKAALAEALKAAGSKEPAEGDELWVRFTKTEPSIINGKPGLPQKIFDVRYKKGAGRVGEFLGAAADAKPAASFATAGPLVSRFDDEPPF